MLPETLKRSYSDFYEATFENGILDAKTTLMIQMAAAFALGCYP